MLSRRLRGTPVSTVAKISSRPAPGILLCPEISIIVCSMRGYKTANPKSTTLSMHSQRFRLPGFPGIQALRRPGLNCTKIVGGGDDPPALACRPSGNMDGDSKTTKPTTCCCFCIRTVSGICQPQWPSAHVHLSMGRLPCQNTNLSSTSALHP